MDVRDAVEADAEALAAIADAPVDVMRNLIHDRTVRVAETAVADGPTDPETDGAADAPAADGDPGAGGGPGADRDPDAADPPAAEGSPGTAGVRGNGVATDEESLLGFVSYDARESAVHVTQFGGTADACERLLDEPVRFARAEGMAVEVLVEAEDSEMRTAAENAGFAEVGTGPMFRGSRTVRYRTEPA